MGDCLARETGGEGEQAKKERKGILCVFGQYRLLCKNVRPVKKAKKYGGKL